VEKLSDRKFKLRRRIWFLDELAARDEQLRHIGRQRSSGCIQNAQAWPERGHLIGNIVSAESQSIEAYVDKKRIDML